MKTKNVWVIYGLPIASCIFFGIMALCLESITYPTLCIISLMWTSLVEGLHTSANVRFLNKKRHTYKRAIWRQRWIKMSLREKTRSIVTQMVLFSIGWIIFEAHSKIITMYFKNTAFNLDIVYPVLMFFLTVSLSFLLGIMIRRLLPHLRKKYILLKSMY
jgi:hypothetical protein